MQVQRRSDVEHAPIGDFGDDLPFESAVDATAFKSRLLTVTTANFLEQNDPLSAKAEAAHLPSAKTRRKQLIDKYWAISGTFPEFFIGAKLEGPKIAARG